MRNRALELLRRAVDDPCAQFRPGQWEAIQGLVEGRERLLVVERTGWGKSIDLLDKAGRTRLAELKSPELAPEIIERLLDQGAALGIMSERWTSRKSVGA